MRHQCYRHLGEAADRDEIPFSVEGPLVLLIEICWDGEHPQLGRDQGVAVRVGLRDRNRGDGVGRARPVLDHDR